MRGTFGVPQEYFSCDGSLLLDDHILPLTVWIISIHGFNVHVDAICYAARPYRFAGQPPKIKRLLYFGMQFVLPGVLEPLN